MYRFHAFVLGALLLSGCAAAPDSAMTVGHIFQDCVACPEMVVVPAGSFMMGAPDTQEPRASDESQRHVTIALPFAVGVYEVTFEEWDACIEAGACTHRFSDFGWGRGKSPLMLVRWADAQEYVQWLSQRTGQNYRLLTEAEWEYVARAGTTTVYWQGDTISHDDANYGEDECCKGVVLGRDRWINTAPVGSFPANAFGLYDVHGNVWELVKDCYDDYADAPIDGSARTGDALCNHVMRGGTWIDHPGRLRASNRNRTPSLNNGILSDEGFRIARDL